MSEHSLQLLDALRRRLRHARRRVVGAELLFGLVLTLGVLAAALGIGAALEAGLWMGTAARLLCTLKGLDPYRDLRHDPVIGPIEGLLSPLPLPEKPRLFAYLGMEQRVTAKLLAALKASDLPAEAYVRGLTEETAKKFLRPGLTFYKAPQPIGQVLTRATLAIHHGGSGMALACCSAGRPQLVLPIHEETLLKQQALQRIGVGGTIAHKDLESDGATRLAEAEANPRRRERARLIAEEIAAAGPFRPLDHILASCRTALGANAP